MSKSLSIVIPAYNEERFLDACLQAIAKQTVPPDEVIVLDNNSTDRTAEIAKSYPFVRLLPVKRQGIVYARNAGFDAAKGDIIGRIDADTRLPSDWVERVKRYYADNSHEEYALAGGGCFYNLRFPTANGWVHSVFAFRLNRLIVGHYVLWGSNMALPASCWRSVRRQVCIREDVHEDFDLSFHLHQAGKHIDYKQDLKVEASLGRMFSDPKAIREYMRRWPQTLRVHHFRLWWLGLVGNWLILYMVRPLMLGLEYMARRFGKEPVQL